MNISVAHVHAQNKLQNTMSRFWLSVDNCSQSIKSVVVVLSLRGLFCVTNEVAVLCNRDGSCVGTDCTDTYTK